MLTAIFIDGGYLDKCANQGLDYVALSRTLAGNERLLQTYYYNGYPYDPTRIKNPLPQHQEVYDKKTKFFRGLETLAKFTCRYGYTVYRDGIFMQKGVDSLLVVDMLTLAARKTVDSIKLLAGDRDLISGVKAARDFGVVVDLFTFDSKTYAHSLRDECDSHTELNKDGTIRRSGPSLPCKNEEQAP